MAGESEPAGRKGKGGSALSTEGPEDSEARAHSVTSPDSFVERAEAHRREGRYEEAISVCREGLRRAPGTLRGRLLLGMCYWENGLAAEAKRELETVAEGIEECLPAFKLLSQIYLQERNANPSPQDAKQGSAPLEWSVEEEKTKWKSISGEPGFQDGILGPGETLRGDAMPKVMHTDTLAEIYLKQGHLPKALAIYEEILSREPGNSEVRGKYERLKQRLNSQQKAASRRKVIQKLESWLTAVAPRGNAPSS